MARQLSNVLATANSDGTPWGWGLGFVQSGEILLKRRPLDEATCINLDDMVSDVRSDTLIAHTRHATIGSLRTENTHAFRYQQWMFADTGTVDNFEQVRARMHKSLPEFLQRNLRGDTDSELLFSLFLSFLHDASKLDFAGSAARDVFPAIKSTFGLLDRIGKEAKHSASRLNIILGTPEYLVAARRGAPMAYRVFKGRDDFAAMFDDDEPSALRMHDLDPCRLAVVASDFDDDVIPEGFTEVTDGTVIAFDRTATITASIPKPA
ncbi:MAG: class II glutamine amidotransferase [Polyangiaceae bacterium]